MPASAANHVALRLALTMFDRLNPSMRLVPCAPARLQPGALTPDRPAQCAGLQLERPLKVTFFSRAGLPPHRGRKGFLKRGEDALVGGIDFGGFEGLFGAAVGEGPGDGFAVCGETFGRWDW